MIITKNEDEITLSFAYNVTLVDDVKTSLEKRRYNLETKEWTCKDTARNQFVISYLTGKKPYLRFKEPLPNFIPNQDMWKHQVEMFRHLYRRTHIIAGQMRTGKTRPTLLLINGLSEIGKAKGVPWFITTKSAIRGIKVEMSKWNIKCEIALMTHHAFRNLLSEVDINKCKDIIPNILVFDEAHKLKDPNSVIGSTARQLADVHERMYANEAYRFLLSGTPSPQSPADWWNLCEVACPGYLREGNIHLFKQRYGNFEKAEGLHGQYNHLIEWKRDEIAKLYNRMQGLVSIYLKKNCLDLPEILYTKINLPVSDEYKGLMSLVNNTYTNALKKLGALRALSDGFMYNKDYNEETGDTGITPAYMENPKNQQLIEDLEEFEESVNGLGRIVIYCGFTASVDKVTAICLKEGWCVLRIDGRGSKVYGGTESVETCLSEMDGSTNIGKIGKLAVVAQTDAASTGLEFSASPVIIYFSNSFNAASREQSEARPHSTNMNRERGLEIRDYIHLPTDDLVIESLKRKRTLQSISMGEIDATIKSGEIL